MIMGYNGVVESFLCLISSKEFKVFPLLTCARMPVSWYKAFYGLFFVYEPRTRFEIHG